MKRGFEIQLKENADVFKAQSILQKTPGVLKAYIVTGQTLRCYYDDRKIQPKLLLKAVSKIDSSGEHRRRKRNIASVKEVHD